MATVKKIVKKTRYIVSAKLKVDVGITIEADSLEEAVTKANALKILDFIDFDALGLDHNDSEQPEIYGLYKND